MRSSVLSTEVVGKSKKHGLSSHATRGELIRRARIERGWTQKQLGAKVGSDQAYINKLEHDIGNPGVKKLEKVAAVLGISFSIGETSASPENALAGVELDDAVRQALIRALRGESKS